MNRLNIKRFAPSVFGWDIYELKNIKRDGNGNLTQVDVYATLFTTGNSIDTIYEFDANGNTSLATDSWTIETEVNNRTIIHKRYDFDTSDIKGIEVHNWSNNYKATLYFHFTVIDSNKTTYLTKTSATAVLKGNVVNDLNTYDYNNAPSIAAVRNYFESGSVVQSQKEWLKDLILETTHPIGSLEINTSGINPSEYLGGGWESFGSGRTLVGVDSSDSDFDTAEETGGEKTHTLTTNEMPSHSHKTWLGTTGGAQETLSTGDRTEHNWGATSALEATGGSQAHNNLQPYITVYFWKRIS